MGPSGLSMGRKHLKFIQVSVGQVVQLELHPFLTAAHVGLFERNWFLSHHMKEVEELLRPVLTGFTVWDCSLLKDRDMKKLTQTCLLGSTVRLGFTLKAKREHHCLLNRSSYRAGYAWQNVQGLKLVAYVCPRLQGISQPLASAFGQLLHTKDDAEQTDISSYFRPLTSSATNTTTATNTATTSNITNTTATNTATTSNTTATNTATTSNTTAVRSYLSSAIVSCCADVVSSACETHSVLHHCSKRKEKKKPTLEKLKRQRCREKDKTDCNPRERRGEQGTADSTKERREEHRIADSTKERREEHGTADSPRERREEHRTANSPRERREEHRTADSPRERREEHGTADSTKERREEHRIANSPRERREEHRIADSTKERREEHGTADSPRERREEHRTANSPRERREEHRTADSPRERREEHGTADSTKERREEHRIANSPRERREEHRTAESPRERREENGTADNTIKKRTNLKTADSSKGRREGHRTAWRSRRERREGQRRAERRGERRAGLGRECDGISTSDDSDRQGERKPTGKNRTAEVKLNSQPTPERLTPPATPERQTPPPPGDRHQAAVSKPQDRRGESPTDRATMNPARPRSELIVDLTLDNDWELPDLTVPQSRVQGHKLSLSRSRGAHNSSMKKTVAVSKQKLGITMTRTGAVDRKMKSGCGPKTTVSPCRISPEAVSNRKDDSRETTWHKSSDRSKKPGCSNDSDCSKTSQKRSFRLVDIDFGFSSPEPALKKKCSPSSGNNTKAVKSSENNVKQSYQKSDGDSRGVLLQEQHRKDRKDIHSDRKSDRSQSPISPLPKTLPVNVNAKVDGKLQRLKTSTKQKRQTFLATKPETHSLQKSLFPSSTSSSHPKRKDSSRNFEHCITSKHIQTSSGKPSSVPPGHRSDSSPVCKQSDPSSDWSPGRSRQKNLEGSVMGGTGGEGKERKKGADRQTHKLLRAEGRRDGEGRSGSVSPLSVSPLSYQKRGDSPQRDSRSDSEALNTSSVIIESMSSAASSSSERLALSPRFPSSRRLPSQRRQRCSVKTSCSAQTSGTPPTSGTPSGSPSTPKSARTRPRPDSHQGSASTPKSSRTLPGTPSSPRTADAQPGSPSTPRASGTPLRRWPCTAQATTTAAGKDALRDKSDTRRLAKAAAHRGFVDSQSEDWLPDLDDSDCADLMQPCSGTPTPTTPTPTTTSPTPTTTRKTSNFSPIRTGRESVSFSCAVSSSESSSAATRNHVDGDDDADDGDDDEDDTSHSVCEPSPSQGNRVKAVKRSRFSSPENSGDPVPKRCRKASGERTPLSSLVEGNQGEDTDPDSSLRCLELLSDKELQAMMKDFRSDLVSISQGSLYSHRHQLYVTGGHARRQLDYRSNLQYFASGQEDVVMDILMTLFTRLQVREMDYLLRVLLPEALHRIYRRVTGTSLP